MNMLQTHIPRAIEPATRTGWRRGLGLALASALWASPGLADDAEEAGCSPLARGAEVRPLPGPLASPGFDWRDQVIYFALIDRFDDADADNNDQGAGEYDPSDPRRYSGGDLAGLTRRLDYIRGLGASALWITPPVRHQWWDGQVGYGGYHGYWAQHFMEVDPHFGSLQDYRLLACGLHSRDMVLVQDIVVNHVGNYFRYAQPPGADPAQGWQANPDSRPTTAPTQWPFSANDPRDPTQRALEVYHWTPDIRDYADPGQLLRWQMSGLDDLATETPLVRQALRQSYAHWIREVGVDAFRVDTAFYVPPEFFRDFLWAEDPEAPGVMRVAQAEGRGDFLLFGEGFATDRAFEEIQARRIEAYARDAEGPLLHSMLNFPLYGSLREVFAGGRAPAELAYRIDSLLRVHADPWRMPSFIDNHDVDRFLASAGPEALRLALFSLFTLPGIPTIYYGTEQGFTRTRGSMFAGGFGSEGRDHFDSAAPLYQDIAGLAALRRAHAPLRRGRPQVLAAEAAAPGLIAWRSEYEDQQVLVAINTSTRPSLYGAIASGLEPGQRLRPVYAIAAEPAPLQVEADGSLHLLLPPMSAAVWAPDHATDAPSAATAGPHLDSLRLDRHGELLRIRGHAAPASPLLLVMDGDLGRATAVQADRLGRLRLELPVQDLIDESVLHRVQLWQPESGRASDSKSFRPRPIWTRVLEASDPAGDDRGPGGDYRPPTDAGWRRPGLLDLRRVALDTRGGSLRLELEMGAISQGWNPANGFDRVAFTVFLELPERSDGSEWMPLQNDRLPEGMRWHYRLRAHGWSNVLFGSQGATADSEGLPLGAAMIEVDAEQRRIRFTLPANLLGQPASLEGARLFVSTWDYDGGFRGLSPEGAAMEFGGGRGCCDPLWMDTAGPLRIPAR